MLFALGGLGVRFRAVHGAVRVVGRRVERVELELVRPGVDHVVPDAGGNDERPVVAYVVGLVDRILGAAELEAGLALLDADELVVLGVDLEPDVLS